ncbi:nitrate/nitrite transporter NrtS [Zwartia panacis]|uniref:nitrate/nitrite transporter NrtS n=1 Tax=Zwartia panacis TaxID=2683345 RepID=UPI0025B42180|nr:nitrate/nitrite transporter NrtS [Zwartia panacis]MDN4016150.1 nitrate/nitrite transporter NrtS [Zwartia panacis]
MALLVGSVLNLINQGDAILGPAEISWAHVALNFFVPFCVSSYSAARKGSPRFQCNK